MFGFSLAAQLFQGSAQRTWNCVTQFTNLLWYKFNHIRHPIMPRSRRRHHSRSRSRSRSHSHDRDREPKRRKIDSVESPTHKRSVSCDPQISTEKPNNEEFFLYKTEIETPTRNDEEVKCTEIVNTQNDTEKSVKQVEDKLTITPKKTMSPKQIQKKLDSEKKRQQKQQEREDRERKKLEEKERIRLEKLKEKQEKEEMKRKEKEEKDEQKRKEREQKEAKRKEKEEREELKRKEREQEKLKKQQELEEKHKEKQKQEEQKLKASQAFVNFFVVPKKPVDEKKSEVKKISNFMPFQVKSDMKLAPLRRPDLTNEEKDNLIGYLENFNENASYLKDLKNGKNIGKSFKTWPYDEDVIIVDEDFGDSICEDKPKRQKMRSKFLKFHENRRPAYYGTWRKKSNIINPRKPFVEDQILFDYEVDSDDDWEEEEQGESITGSDDEEKENDVENDDYEVDNEFFVPHGHLSDDEIDDEATARLSPESHKQKLKLLKDEFDQDMQMKTNKMKPRSIGCIWYNKYGTCDDETIDRHLRPLAMITNGRVIINKRKDMTIYTSNNKKIVRELRAELMPQFLKLIHGNTNKRTSIVEEFITSMHNNAVTVDVSKAGLGRLLRRYAQWKKCPEEGNKLCWYVEEEIRKKYNV